MGGLSSGLDEPGSYRLGPIGGLAAVLSQKGAHETLETKANANAMRPARAFNIDFKSPSEEIRMVVQGTDCQPFVSRQQRRNFVLGFRSQLEVSPRRRVGRYI